MYIRYIRGTLELPMRKRITILLLLPLYVFSTVQAFLPLVHYVVDRDYYTTRCENKAKPELDCDGCCQVKKEIAAEAAHDTDQSSKPQSLPQSQSTNTNQIIELFHILTNALEFSSPETGTMLFLAFVNTSLLFSVGQVPFQPPRA
jgi:hypothetical protein